ncbi:MAG TPA: hypothetical protein VK726_00315 [Acetobacteraceae bacterium]|jgi:hypothetical protein|nr:hypothetical protein [Acetobacteraceae bacterium]
MKIFALTAFAILGVVFSAATVTLPAHASTVSLFPPSQSNG